MEPGLGWRWRAACRDMNPELFEPWQNKVNPEAAAACAVCPVAEQCKAQGLAIGDTHMVRAGMTPNQRRAERAKDEALRKQPTGRPMPTLEQLYLDGYPPVRIAAILGIPPRTARYRISVLRGCVVRGDKKKKATA